MKIQLFVPCFVDQLFPQTAFNMISILEKLDCEVVYNPQQTCCGQPAFNAGHWNESKIVAQKFLDDFDPENYIVTPSGSCTGFVRNHYHKLLSGKIPPKDLGVKNPLLRNIFEFSEFLVQKLDYTKIKASMDGVGTYHDSCGALRECGIKSAPRKLLENVEGLKIVETEDSEVCCGFGGTFAIKYEPISTAMTEQKVHNAVEKGADYIISTDLSCLMQMDGYIKKHNYKIKTIHIVDVLSRGLNPKYSSNSGYCVS
ncbi:(Fe-S)-binding protein [Membranihabitans maritimus]|uniref:(Fe-S)-binding protein n=1 Tax=Membranihabitans maritimus TaxID=2904244 RepID=UPI001F168099|nr:(Fe-S)-binding protein [Membranihabitans maritimus]